MDQETELDQESAVLVSPVFLTEALLLPTSSVKHLPFQLMS